MTDRMVIREAIIAGRAVASGDSPEDVEAAIAANGGDDHFELDSKTAEWVIVYVEQVLQLGTKLPTPSDLGRDQFATIGALITAIADALGVTD
ncbi:hypothetical protein [Streptosporangium sp. H16]|uniref:hypothetical protein n=1 Tax=Streptosporangium sp. H16 TaxID=3444184 RepID=UPI003F79FB80